MKIPLAICLALALPACAAAPVQDYGTEYAEYTSMTETYSREGGYLGISAAYGVDNFDVASGLSVDNSPGFGIRGGYRTSERFAIELAGESMTGYDLKVSNPFFGTQTGTLKTQELVVQAKAFLATKSVQPYVLAGLGYEHAEVDGDSDDGTLLRFGLGSDFYLSKDTALFVEGTWNSVSMKDFVDLDGVIFQVGVLFRF